MWNTVKKLRTTYSFSAKMKCGHRIKTEKKTNSTHPKFKINADEKTRRGKN